MLNASVQSTIRPKENRSEFPYQLPYLEPVIAEHHSANDHGFRQGACMKTATALSAAFLIIAIETPQQGHTKPLNAKCLLVIDGITKLDDRCSFTSNNDSESFSDERLLLVCPDGQSVTTSECYGYQQRVARKGIYGALLRTGLTARLCWNTGSLRNAQSCFAGLERQGNCWQSRSAKSTGRGTMHQVKFCAWGR